MMDYELLIGGFSYSVNRGADALIYDWNLVTT